MKIFNAKARFNYEIKDTLESGIVLMGSEVKSVRKGRVDMSHAYVKILPSTHHGQHEVYLMNMRIDPYEHANNATYDPQRVRKLLLHQKEILNLQIKMKQSRLLLIPISMYTRSSNIKVEIGLARGKKIYEKRESIKKSDQDRDAERDLR